MIYTKKIELQCPVAQGVHHGAAPIPEEGQWISPKEIKDIKGYTHGSAGARRSRVPASCR